MRRLIDINKNITKKISSHLGENKEYKLDMLMSLFKRMDQLEFMSGNAQQQYSSCYSINIYFKEINLFTLSIWEKFIRVEAARRNESGTISMKRIPLVENCVKDVFNLKKKKVAVFYFDSDFDDSNDKNIVDLLLSLKEQLDEDLKEYLYDLYCKDNNFCLEKIGIKNYKLFQDVLIELSPRVNLFVGDNGNGKTTLLNALFHCISAFQYFFREAKNYNKNKLNPEEDIRYEILSDNGILNIQRHKEVRIAGEIKFNNTDFEIIRAKKVGGILSGSSENGELKNYIEILELANDTFCKPMLPIFAFYTTNRLYSKNSYSNTAANSRYDVYNESVRYRNNIERVANWMLDCFIEEEKYGKDIRDFKIVKAAIEKTYHQLLNIGKESDDTVQVKYLKGEMVLETSTGNIGFKQMSDGYQSVFGIITDLAFRILTLNPLEENALEETPGLILIDEVDLHLHPNWQKKILGVLNNVFPKIQIVATTHSPFIIQALDIEKDKLFLLKNQNVEEAELNDYLGLEDTVYTYMDVNNPRWSEHKNTEFISYSDFMKLYDSYFEMPENREDIMKKMEISLKQNATDIEVNYELEKKLAELKLLQGVKDETDR